MVAWEQGLLDRSCGQVPEVSSPCHQLLCVQRDVLHALCSAGISNTPGTLDSSVIHTNATSLGACVPPLATAANKLAAPASDAAVTAAARAVMGDYPKPYDA
jgi:hypothetical protein